MGPSGTPRPDRRQTLLAAGMLLSYAIGYPVALAAHSPVGWALVVLGGVFLMLLLLGTVRRLAAAGQPSAVGDPLAEQAAQDRLDIGGGPGAR